MNLSGLIEELAAVEHERWSHWQRHMHEQCDTLPDGRLAVPSKLVKQWERQLSTPYEQLSEEEKDSDREQVRKAIPIIQRYLDSPES